MAFFQAYIRHSTPLPPLESLAICNVPEEDHSLATFLRYSAPHAQLNRFFFNSCYIHGQLENYLEAVEALAPSVSEKVALDRWDITSTDMMNRLVKAASGTQQLSIREAEFSMEEACDFGADTKYMMKVIVLNNSIPFSDENGFTIPQLELIARGIAASPLKKSLQTIEMNETMQGIEQKEIEQKEAETVLKKYGLSKIKIKWDTLTPLLNKLLILP